MSEELPEGMAPGFAVFTTACEVAYGRAGKMARERWLSMGEQDKAAWAAMERQGGTRVDGLSRFLATRRRTTGALDTWATLGQWPHLGKEARDAWARIPGAVPLEEAAQVRLAEPLAKDWRSAARSALEEEPVVITREDLTGPPCARASCRHPRAGHWSNRHPGATGHCREPKCTCTGYLEPAAASPGLAAYSLASRAAYGDASTPELVEQRWALMGNSAREVWAAMERQQDAAVMPGLSLAERLDGLGMTALADDARATEAALGMAREAISDLGDGTLQPPPFTAVPLPGDPRGAEIARQDWLAATAVTEGADSPLTAPDMARLIRAGDRLSEVARGQGRAYARLGDLLRARRQRDDAIAAVRTVYARLRDLGRGDLCDEIPGWLARDDVPDVPEVLVTWDGTGEAPRGFTEFASWRRLSHYGAGGAPEVPLRLRWALMSEEDRAAWAAREADRNRERDELSAVKRDLAASRFAVRTMIDQHVLADGPAGSDMWTSTVPGSVLRRLAAFDGVPGDDGLRAWLYGLTAGEWLQLAGLGGQSELAPSTAEGWTLRELLARLAVTQGREEDRRLLGQSVLAAWADAANASEEMYPQERFPLLYRVLEGIRAELREKGPAGG